MKKLAILAIMLILCALMCPAVSAYSGDMIDQQIRDSGADKLQDALPDDAADAMEETGVSLDSLTSGEGMGINDLFGALGRIFEDAYSEPMAVCGVLIAMIILASLAEGARSAIGSDETAASISPVISAAVCVAVMLPAAKLIEQAALTLGNSCEFAAVFIPVLAAIMTALGRAMAAGSFGAFMLTLTEMILIATDRLFLPGARILLSLTAVTAVSPSMNIESVTGFIDRNLKWILGLLAVLMVGTLGVGTSVAASVDGVAGKTAKFVMSNAVPVVGRAMSEALGTVAGCVGILKTSAGGFCIIAMMFIYLPVVVRCILWICVMGICGALADMLGAASIKKMLGAVSGIFSVVLALLLFVAVVMITSTAIFIGRAG